MKVYMVLNKVFYTSNGKDYQVADALQPITVFSSKKKAYKAMEEYEKYFQEIGYKRASKYNNLFPIEHFTMYNNSKTMYRVIIELIESEVE